MECSAPFPGPPPREVGPYRLLEPLGEGGMGQVFLAEDPDGRRVALKLVQPWLESGSSQVRFRRERQVLAGLTHPGIARLLDGGTGSDGRPYLVLEHVVGRPIDRHCDEERLSVRQRVELFLAVLEAVAHAHRNLVVHGDLKPDNVLVDATGRPRLLDFGVATLLDPEERAAALVESGRTRYLTPAYASPEQRRGEPLTPASDVYALCAVLYELLTGHPPLGVDTTRETASPPRPSTIVLSGSARTARGGRRTTVDARDAGRLRASTPRRLARTLSGTLDEILLRGLSHGPRRRQADAAALREELRAWCEGRSLPGASLPRQLRDLGRRHPLRLAAALGTPLLVAVATAGVLTARGRAEQAWEAAREARAAIGEEARSLEELTRRATLDAARAEERRGELEAGLAALDARTEELEQRRRRTRALGESLQRFSVRLQRDVVRALELEGLDPLRAEVGLALLEESLAHLEAIGAGGASEDTRLELASAYLMVPRLAGLDRVEGWQEARVAALERADALTSDLVRTSSDARARSLRAFVLYWRAHLARDAGAWDEALDLAREACRQALEAPMPEASIVRIDTHLTLASLLRDRGDAPGASAALETAEALLEGVDAHEQPAHLITTLAGVPLERARLAFTRRETDVALAAQQRAVELLARAAEPAPAGSAPRVRHLTERATLATYLLEAGRLAEGRELLLADAPRWDELADLEPSWNALLQERTYRARLAQASAWSQDWPRAHAATRRRLELARRLAELDPSPGNAREVAVSELRLGQFELSMGRIVEATERLQSARAALEALLDEDPDHVLARVALVDGLEALGDVFGVRGSQLTDARDQLRLVQRAEEALEGALASLDELERRGQLQPVHARSRPRLESKLEFARNVLGQIEAALEAAGGPEDADGR